MNGFHKYILIFLCADSQVKEDIKLFLTKFKNLAVQSSGILQDSKSDVNSTSQEFCMKTNERAHRFKRIIDLQKQLILKLQSQLLEKVLNCSNLRQRVRRLSASYMNLKSEFEELKPKNTKMPITL
ncbi:uncharacterized protein LOC122618169 isoform X2 [Drosophila teissieri]|uniref:uncharacterized protein LOC122618169 isoform X2 n=1 Tax=Drosophila teissieri TaxID=7243 RepID=UPI001CB9E72C|nr:uncharacterized protein LOC122618169 isoform X2 [Drosophila teissieri]